MYDVIVIGAGPCGCSAAITLSTAGLKTLLLEKCKLPRYKSCSGILIDKSIKFIERQFGRSVPDCVTCAPKENRGMVFTDDVGAEYRFESRGLNIWRDKFDNWLTSLAKERGAEVRDDGAVTDIKDDGGVLCVTVNGAFERSRFVIDCSGAVGIGNRERDNIITYQTYNSGVIDLDAHYFYAYLQPDLSGYDAWFNVKDGMLVLGVAAENPHDIKKYYGKFTAYMKQRHGLRIAEQLRTDKWIIRNVSPSFDIDCGSGGVLKAGECAGFLNPMGEGISCALESGRAAALAVLSDFNDREKVFETYKSNISETADYMRRQWKLVGRMSKKFSFMS